MHAHVTLNIHLTQKKLKPCSHHTHDVVRRTIECQILADDGGIAAQMSAPELVAQNRSARCRRLILSRSESAAQQRLHIENRKKRSGGLADPYLQRLSHTCEAAAVAAKTCEALEGTSLRLPIEKVEPCNACLPSFDLLLIDHHQAIGMWVWQALEKNGLHYAVDGRVRTDTKRQCDQCD